MTTTAPPDRQPDHPESVVVPTVEQNGINVIAPVERRGRASDLFWPWCGANIGVLGMGYAVYLLFANVSFWQALIAGVIGIVLSYLLVGFTSLAGKRGSAPTMVLSRAAFGFRGNKVPTLVSYLLLVGFETVTVVLCIFAVDTVFLRLGWSDGTLTRVIAFVVVAAVIAAAGFLGFDTVMKFQKYITIVMVVLTVGYMVLTVKHINLAQLQTLPSGSFSAFIGALIIGFTLFGLSWTNTGADYSRYLPKNVRGSKVVGWTTLGGAIGPVFLILFGLLITGSSPALASAVADSQIGGLGTILPTWYLIPFILVALLGQMGGAVLDIYSSGLALLSLGLKIPRYSAVLIDAVIMVLGTIYLVWIAPGDFFGSLFGFLVTLGVPIASWTGIFLADMLLRRKDYVEPDLYTSQGRYGVVNYAAVALMAVGSFIGFGLVVSTVSWLEWQGYLLEVFGLGGRTGSWAAANLGVVASLLIGFVGYLVLCRGRVAAQERL
ncbi:purine-cytosine permease-like protein [Nakamurella sp. UYEF19]|uniref:purine-cytosine permease family protein n=1 Tax=Nakamurella sp. UYEF19 TaxID=1756392 RepID=UPI003392593B